VVEGAALEKRCAGNRTEGSNPSLSAITNDVHLDVFCYVVRGYVLFCGTECFFAEMLPGLSSRQVKLVSAFE